MLCDLFQGITIATERNIYNDMLLKAFIKYCKESLLSNNILGITGHAAVDQPTNPYLSTIQRHSIHPFRQRLVRHIIALYLQYSKV